MLRYVLLCISTLLVISLNAQNINPTQTDEIINDQGTMGMADSGDRIQYKVTITETGNATGANSVQLNVTPDVLTTFVPGSFKSSPLAIEDAYACTGNVGISVPAASGLLANDFDDDIMGLSCTAGTVASINAGSAMINSNGSFDYTPAPGFTGTDMFNYTLNDGNDVDGPMGPIPGTDMGTVIITVSNLIWFIDNSSVAPTSDGRLTSPFKSLADFNTNSATVAEVIYIEHTGTDYTGGIMLANNERLFGEGHTGTVAPGENLSSVLPFSLAPNSKTLPNIDGPRPFLTNNAGAGIQLGMNNTIRGVDAGTTMSGEYAIRDNANNLGNLTISDASINNTLGAFRSTVGGTLNVTFSSITATSGGAVNGIFLQGTNSGTFIGGTGSISGMTGSPILIGGGTVALDYDGSLSKTSAGRLVDIQMHATGTISLDGNLSSTGSSTGILVNGNTSGTISFNGNTKTLTTGANTAVTLSTNTGATINFTGGGLVITTTSGTGFNATGGGTLTVQGSNNTIVSTTGTALNVVNTTIGTNGLNFRSISAGTASNSAGNGIALDNTGTSGGLTVAGMGSAGSGGTIQHKTGSNGSSSGIGIYLNNTKGASFGWMQLNDFSNYAINGNTVNGFLLNNCIVSGTNGDHAGTNDSDREASIFFTNLTGVSGVLNSNIAGGFTDNLRFINTTAGTSNLTITGNNIHDNGTVSGEAGVYLRAASSSIVTASISGNTLNHNRTDHVSARAEGTATLNITISGNTLIGDRGVGYGGNTLGGTILVTADNSADVSYNINGNNIQGAVVTAITVFSSALSTSSASMSGTISSNTIGSPGTTDSGSAQGSGINVNATGLATHTALITGNYVYQYNNPYGIAVEAGDGSAPLSATITNNTVANPGGFALNGVLVTAGKSSTPTNGGGADNQVVCAEISGNNIVGSGAGGGSDFRIRQRFLTTIQVRGYTGANSNDATLVAHVQSQNPGAETGSATNNVVGGGGGFTNTPGSAVCPQPATTPLPTPPL